MGLSMKKNMSAIDSRNAWFAASRCYMHGMKNVIETCLKGMQLASQVTQEFSCATVA